MNQKIGEQLFVSAVIFGTEDYLRSKMNPSSEHEKDR